MSLKKMDEADNPRMESSVHGSGRGMRRKSEFLYSDVKSPKRRNEGPMEDKTQEDVKEDFQRKQAWLTFGAYTEELPPAKEQIKNQVLWKMASTSGIWSQRQVILTKSLLLIAKIDTNVISESIPLHQIDRVAIVSETGGDHVLGEFKTGSADDDLGQESKLKDQDPFKRAKPGTVFMFQIFMRPDSVVGARSFSFRAESRKDAEEWVNFVSKIAERALKAHVSNNPELDSMLRLRLTMKEIYKRNSIQAFIGAMIMLNFVFNLLEAEDMPERGSPAEAFYDWLDNAFLIFFMCEMCLVLFIWQRFTFRSGWRVFDLVVIFVSVIFTFLVKGKFQVLRLVRVFRVVKGVRTLSSFRLIINALSSAVLPVLSAFGILIVVMCIYAVMAVDLFAERDPESFGNLSRALFSIFQVTTGDGWSELAKDQMLDLDETGLAFDKAVGFFFISIVLVCGVVLTNVVIAVLLDEFVQSVAAEKQAEASDAVFKANQAMEHKGPLDPLLAPLTHFNTHDDLLAKISGLFHLMDVDENGSLTLEEMRTALTKAGIHLSDEDWSDIFQSVGEDEFSEPRMNHETFSAFIQAQLKLYVQRHIASAMLEATATSSSKDSAVLFVLKHLIVAMETIMRGQDEISELQEKYHVPHAFTANTTDWQHAMASRLDHVDDRLDRFDQKLDAVLRLVGRSSAPAPAAVPAPAAEGATDSFPSDQAVATGAGGTGLFGMDALWNGLGGGVSIGRNEKPQSRQKKVPASVPTSAYLPVSYEKDAARQKIAVQGDLARHAFPDPSFVFGGNWQ